MNRLKLKLWENAVFDTVNRALLLINGCNIVSLIVLIRA